MVGWLWTMGWGVAAWGADPCEGPESSLRAFEEAVLEARYDDARKASAAAVEAFGCARLAAKEQVARLWLAEALVLSGGGEEEAADAALAAARTLAPDYWNANYGTYWKERWQATVNRQPPGTGRLDVGPLPPDVQGAIDGTWRDFPATVRSGLHLVQFGTEDQMAWAQIVQVPEGVPLTLRPVLPSLPVTDAPNPIDTVEPVEVRVPSRSRRIRDALLFGGAAVAAWGVSGAAKVAFTNNQADPYDDDAALRTTGNGFAIGAGALGATSAVLLVRGILTPAARSPELGP